MIDGRGEGDDGKGLIYYQTLSMFILRVLRFVVDGFAPPMMMMMITVR